MCYCWMWGNVEIDSRTELSRIYCKHFYNLYWINSWPTDLWLTLLLLSVRNMHLKFILLLGQPVKMILLEPYEHFNFRVIVGLFASLSYIIVISKCIISWCSTSLCLLCSVYDEDENLKKLPVPNTLSHKHSK